MISKPFLAFLVVMYSVLQFICIFQDWLINNQFSYLISTIQANINFSDLLFFPPFILEATELKKKKKKT